MTTHEALWAEDFFKQGIGWVIVARFKSGGQRVESGIFLVDVGCLGVKLAIYEAGERRDYRERIRAHYEAKFPMVEVEPARARKFVEDSIKFAERLGFAPHSDFKKAARVFGGVDATQCPEHFTFGRDGKPFYMRGPRETEEQARRIVQQLAKRCGEGNFHYVVPLGNAEEISRDLENTKTKWRAQE